MNIIYSIIVSFVSSLAGNSSKLLLTPLIGSILGSEAVLPVVTIETLFSNSQKILLLWQAIDWRVLKWYFPGAGIGNLLSAYVFARANDLQRLPILLGLYFITAVFNYYLRRNNKHFTVRCWYFLFAGFACTFISKFLGSTGSLLNDFYLNYGLNKDQAIATKAANLLGINILKMFIYFICGALTKNYLIYGVAIAIIAVPANLLAQIALQKLDGKFNPLANYSTTVSTVLILWQQNYCHQWLNSVCGKTYLLTTFFANFPSLSPLIG